MISSIYAEKVKGLTFRQKLSKRTLLLGPVGSGKSARGQAIMLAILGFVPGGPKKNDEILSTYGDGQAMKAVITVDGDELGRSFVNSGTSVSQSFGICGKKGKEADFSKALGSHGDPRIVDVGAFMALSSQKQVDTLFALYPPDEDINKLQAVIDTEAARLASIVERKKGVDGTVARLIASKTELPSGTLAETNDSIKTLEADLEQATQDLATANERERAAIVCHLIRKELAEKKEADRIFQAEQARIREAEAKAKAADQATSERPVLSTPLADREIGYPVNRTIPVPEPDHRSATFAADAITEPVPTTLSSAQVSPAPTVVAKADIKAIILAMEAAGCEACAAMMVAKRELRKSQEVK